MAEISGTAKHLSTTSFVINSREIGLHKYNYQRVAVNICLYNRLRCIRDAALPLSVVDVR